MTRESDGFVVPEKAGNSAGDSVKSFMKRRDAEMKLLIDVIKPPRAKTSRLSTDWLPGFACSLG